MLNYKITGNYNPFDSLYDNMLRERGLTRENVETLLNVPKECMEDWRNLENIEKAVKTYLKHLENDSEIGMIQDADADGITSCAELYNFTKKIAPEAKISVYFHKEKTHGIHKNIKIEDKIQLLLVTDAGTSDCDEQEKLCAKGVEVIITDHHLPEEGWRETEAIIVNNQMSPRYKNKSISGSGVTFKFMKAVDFYLGTNYADDYIDLAGIGCIGDMMDSKELDSRYIMNEATKIENIKNPMLMKLVQDKILKYDKLNGTSIAWKIVPLINSVCRFGTQEEKEKTFNGLTSSDEEIVDLAIKTVVSCKGKQDRAKKKAFELMVAYIEENKLDKYPLMVIDATGMYKSNGLNGVVCNMVADVYNRPVIIVAGDREIMRGSSRNGNLNIVDNLMKWCLGSELFHLVAGHSNAAGIELKRENIQLVMDKALEDFGEPKSEGKTLFVESVLDFKSITKQDILNIGNLEKLWITNLRQPTYVIKGVKVNNADMEKLGSRGNVLRFKVGDITFVKMFLSGEFYDRVTKHKEKAFGSLDLIVDLIVKFNTNEWNGKKYPQMEIIEAHSEIDTRLDEILF